MVEPFRNQSERQDVPAPPNFCAADQQTGRGFIAGTLP